jgi:hypothetical protein
MPINILDNETVAGTLSSSSTIYDGKGGNSAQWDTAYQTLSSIAFTFVNATSSIQPVKGLNVASGNFSVVGGGCKNCATGLRSTVSGGVCNTASGYYSIVGGGVCNTACGLRGSNVSGGSCNTASAYYLSTIGGGKCNTASGNYSTISGGSQNTINDDFGNGNSAISGGHRNTTSAYYSNIAGGNFNTICNNAAGSNISGGCCNTVSGRYSNVAGGYSNTACGDNTSTVSGGACNTASGRYSNIAGGYCNIASGQQSFVAGGSGNNTKGFTNTFILGSNLSASQANFTYVNNLTSQGVVNAVSTNLGTTSSIAGLNVSPLTITGAASGSVFNQIQNTTPGVSSSTDISLYNNDGVNYLDLGIASTKYNGNLYSPVFNVVRAGDSYVYATSGNLVHGAADVNGNQTFFTGGTLTSNERMRITSSGNVGIGTTTPNQALTVVGNVSSTNNIYSNATITSTVSSSNLVSTGNQFVISDGYGNNNNGNGSNTISLNALNGTYIGSKLTVVGDISASGNFTAASKLVLSSPNGTRYNITVTNSGTLSAGLA